MVFRKELSTEQIVKIVQQSKFCHGWQPSKPKHEECIHIWNQLRSRKGTKTDILRLRRFIVNNCVEIRSNLSETDNNNNLQHVPISDHEAPTTHTEERGTAENVTIVSGEKPNNLHHVAISDLKAPTTHTQERGTAEKLNSISGEKPNDLQHILISDLKAPTTHTQEREGTAEKLNTISGEKPNDLQHIPISDLKAPTTHTQEREGTAEKLNTISSEKPKVISPFKTNPEYGPLSTDKKPTKKFSCTSSEKVILGNFHLSPQVVQTIWSNESLSFIPRKYANVLGIKLSESNLIGNCIFYVQTWRLNRTSGNVVIYGYCCYDGCSTFLLKSSNLPAINEPWIFSVERIGGIKHEGKRKQRILNGFARDEAKAKLASKRAFEVRQEELENLSEVSAGAGDYGNVQQLQTYSQARSEEMKKNDKHPDALVSTILDWKEQYNSYTRDDENVPENHIWLVRVGAPFHAVIISIEQLQLFLQSIIEHSERKRGPVLYLDATSSLIRPYTINTNIRPLRCFYYAMVFSLASKVIPLSSAVLSQHDASRISMWLLEVKCFLLAHQNWPIKNIVVVIDGSYPLLYAVLLVFNDMNFPRYLEVCHEYICGTQKDWDETLAIIRSCSSHKVKNFSNMICNDPSIKQKEIREFYKKCFDALIDATKYEQVKGIFKNLFIVLLNQSITAEVEGAIRFLDKCAQKDEQKSSEEEEEDLVCNLETSLEADKEDSRFQYAASPFYKDIKPFYDEALNAAVKGNLSTNENKYFSPKTAISLLRRHAPTINLWTGIMRRDNESFSGDPLHFTNSHVESHIKTEKHDVHKGQTNIRLNRFCRAQRRTLLITRKDVITKLSQKIEMIPKRQRTQKPSHGKVQKRTIIRRYRKATTLMKALDKAANEDFAPLDEEEKWQRKATPKKPSLKTGREKVSMLDTSLLNQLKNSSKTVGDSDKYSRNGLKNTDYYKQIVFENMEDLNYPIAKVGTSLTLTINDLLSLETGNCPTSNIMDILATQLLHLEGCCDQVGYIPTDDSKSILEGYAPSKIVLKLKKEKILQKLYQVMFYQDKHWCFIIIDVKKQKIYFVDPMIEFGAPPSGAQLLRNFLNVARQGSVKQVWKSSSWQLGALAHPATKEKYESGIYSLYFFYYTIKNGNIGPFPIPNTMCVLDGSPGAFDFGSCTTIFKKAALHYADSVVDLCGACLAVVAEGRATKCVECQRAFHNTPRCLNWLVRKRGIIKCRLCVQYSYGMDNPIVETNNLSFYENGIIKNSEYYKTLQVDGTLYDYTIAEFDCFDHLSFTNLRVSDFLTLQPEELVEDSVVDILCHIFIEKCGETLRKKIKHLSINTLTTILDPRSREAIWLNVPAEIKYIVAVRHLGMHYCLLLLDIQNGIMYYVNPYGGETEKFSAIQELKNINEMNDFQKLSSKEFTLKTVEHDVQAKDDGTNCGIYCLYFLEGFLKNQSLKEKLDPTSYREYIKQTILQNSKPLQAICNICSLNIHHPEHTSGEKIIEFLECCRCRRYVHNKLTCLLLDEETLHSGLLNKDKFICKRCRMFCIPM